MKRKVFGNILIVFMLLGFVCPKLFSASSDIAVALGFVTLSVALWLSHRVLKLIKNN